MLNAFMKITENILIGAFSLIILGLLIYYMELVAGVFVVFGILYVVGLNIRHMLK